MVVMVLVGIGDGIDGIGDGIGDSIGDIDATITMLPLIVLLCHLLCLVVHPLKATIGPRYPLLRDLHCLPTDCSPVIG